MSSRPVIAAEEARARVLAGEVRHEALPDSGVTGVRLEAGSKRGDVGWVKACSHRLTLKPSAAASCKKAGGLREERSGFHDEAAGVGVRLPAGLEAEDVAGDLAVVEVVLPSVEDGRSGRGASPRDTRSRGPTPAGLTPPPEKRL